MCNRRLFLQKTSMAAGTSLLPAWLWGKGLGHAPAQQRNWLYEQAASNEDTVKEARANISRIRMRDLELQLLTNSGQPLRQTTVQLTQLSHAFAFGDCNPAMDSIFRKEGGDSE